MKNFLLRLWKEEEGAETAEWLLIVGLLVGVGVAIYPGVLEPALTRLVAAIETEITANF
jgi:Flp pilus assembly pilin Flp